MSEVKQSNLRFIKTGKASLKIQVAHGGETSRNSSAHLRPVGKQPIAAGQCV